MKTSYHELDYESGKAIQTLRGRIGLTQAGLAEHLGVSVRAVQEWESGGSSPKTERLKELIVLAVRYQAFPKGAETEEIRVLWKTTHQKRFLDENWLSTLLQEPDLAPPSVPEIPNHTPAATPPVSETNMNHTPAATPLVSETNMNHTPATTSPVPETKGKSADTPANPIFFEHEYAKAPRTIIRHKWLLSIIAAIVILYIIGSTGALFLYAREQASKTATDLTYPGYLTGHRTLAFFDPLSQQDGSKWDSNINRVGNGCHFSGGAYHGSE